MPKTIKKEKWGKPELIILVRGKPEEKVLVGCKLENSGSSIAGVPGVAGCGNKSGWGCDYCMDSATS